MVHSDSSADSRRSTRRLWLQQTLIAALLAGSAGQALASSRFLNAAYDVTRELYKDINTAFAAEWKTKTGETISINQSHGGSSKQARSVIDGMEASVVSMNQASDIDAIADKGLLRADWAKAYPDQSAPFYSTMVFLTRKGNPRQIKDWADLGQPGLKVIIPNPKTSGNGRYSYLGAWGSVIKNGGSEAQARALVGKIFQNVPVLDAGGRGATTTFTQREIGDVLVTFENEVQLVKQEYGDRYDVVYPRYSVLAESPVALVDKVADKLGTRAQASAWIQFLYSEAGQDIIARHYFRPRSASIARKYAAQFPAVNLFRIEEVFGSWRQLQKKHFDEGGEFDRLFVTR